MMTFHATKRRTANPAHSSRFPGFLRMPHFLKPKPTRRKKTTYILIGLSLFLLGIGLYTVIEKPYQVNQIACTRDQKKCSPELESSFNAFRNQNLFSLNTQSVVGPLYILHPDIKSITVYKRFPGAVSIIITSRQAIALVENQSNQRYGIDDEDRIFITAVTNNLPVIKTTEAVAVGNTAVSKSITASVNLVRILSQSAVAVQTLTLDGSGVIEVLLSSGVVGRFSDEKDLVKQVDTLQYILGEGKIGNNQITMIDVRFDNPVVK